MNPQEPVMRLLLRKTRPGQSRDGQPVKAKKGRNRKMKIGVSSYSFSQSIRKGKLNMFTTIEEAAKLGFEAIEFTELEAPDGETKEELAGKLVKEAARCGIDISAYVVGANLYGDAKEQEAQLNRLKKEVDIANLLGVKRFRYDVIGMLPAGISFEQVLENVAPVMRQLADYAAQYGIVTMIENHGRAFQDSDRVERVYSKINHPNFALLVDMGNFMCADEIPVLSVSRVANLAAHVHAKDFVRKEYGEPGTTEGYFQTRGCNYLKGTAVGYGDCKAAQCVEILKQTGYDGYMDIEFEGPEDCIEELKKGLAFLKGCLA